MKNWARAETRGAAIVSGTRHIRTSRFERAGDVDGAPFSVEVKHRAAAPAVVSQAMRQAERFASEARPALVILYAKRIRQGFAILKTGDFERLFKVALGLPVEPPRKRTRRRKPEPSQVGLFDGGDDAA